MPPPGGALSTADLPSSADPASAVHCNAIPLLHTEGLYRASRGRWWVLLCFVLMGILQAASWNIYGPVYQVALTAFPSWTPAFLDWVINSANISFLLVLYPVALFAARQGHRRVTLVSALCIVICTGLRCLPVADGQLQQVLTVVSMLFNGFGGGWFTFAGPVLSELWFPQTQRTLATAASVGAVAMGQALGFVIGPALVGISSSNSSSIITLDAARAGMDRLFWVEFVSSCLVFLMCMAYYPDQPKHPPSEAAAAKRRPPQHRYSAQLPPSSGDTAYAVSSTGLGVFFPCGGVQSSAAARGKYWALSIAMSVSIGVTQGWSSVFFECLQPLHVTQNEAAWLGFLMTMAGCVVRSAAESNHNHLSAGSIAARACPDSTPCFCALSVQAFESRRGFAYTPSRAPWSLAP